MTLTVNGRRYTLHVRRGDSGLLMADCAELKGLHIMERSYRDIAASAQELIPVMLALRSPAAQ